MRILLAILLLFPAAVQAEPLKAVLVVPQTAISGTDVYLDGSQSTGDIEHFLFFAATKSGVEGRIVSTTDKNKPRMLSFPGEWIVTLIVVSDEGKYDKVTATCTIPGQGGCPEPLPPGPTPIPPNPDPGPQPKPVPPTPQPDVVPAGEFGIAPKIHAIASAVNSPTRAADCKAMADQCDVYAAQIAAGTLTDPQKLVNGMAAEIKKYPAFKDSVPLVGAEIQAAMKAHPARLKVNGLVQFSMADPDGWRQLMKELGVGLRAVK